MKRMLSEALRVVAAAVCFGVAAALALLAVEKAAVDMSRIVFRVSETSGVLPETIMIYGLGALSILAVAVWRSLRSNRGGYQVRRYSRPARRQRR